MKPSSLYCYLLLGGGWLSLAAAAAEQVCMVDGQCFANDEEAHNHYQTGEKVEMYLDEPYSATFGEAQQVAGVNWKETLEVISKSKEYMMEIYNNDTLRNVRNECLVRNELCSFWAAIGR
jgi:hypothetical protein